MDETRAVEKYGGRDQTIGDSKEREVGNCATADVFGYQAVAFGEKQDGGGEQPLEVTLLTSISPASGGGRSTGTTALGRPASRAGPLRAVPASMLGQRSATSAGPLAATKHHRDRTIAARTNGPTPTSGVTAPGLARARCRNRPCPGRRRVLSCDMAFARIDRQSGIIDKE